MLRMVCLLGQCLLASTSDHFVGTEILGRPTATSVTVNAIPAVPMEAYFAFSANTADWILTPVQSYQPHESIEVVLDNLQPNTTYSYKMYYRPAGDVEFLARPIRTFATCPSPDSPFVFAVQADSHLQNILRRIEPKRTRKLQLYHTTIQNMAADQPDLLFDLGDTFSCEIYQDQEVASLEEALQRHYDQREFFDEVCHSAFLFLCLGNHEGEQGWRLANPQDHVAEWATQARLEVYPNPDPALDAFYTGNLDGHENYYAFEWGNSLFVVLDPYRYTMAKPHDRPEGVPGSGDCWDWTLGETQYLWLKNTLQSSPATFKFVFAHQLVGGKPVDCNAFYGRGGVEYVKHVLGGHGSFEWGGENIDGGWGFAVRRPGWATPIHQLLVDNDVTVFFHGHDHFFAYQELDGVVYQEVPTPSDDNYDYGRMSCGGYVLGHFLPSSGHLKVSVFPDYATVDYVRAFLPAEGDNGSVDFSYTLYSCPDVCADFNRDGVTNLPDLAWFAFCCGLTAQYECYCCDVNGNGTVDLCDFATFATFIGLSQPCP